MHACVHYGCFSNKQKITKKTFFNQIAVAHSIFTLDGVGFQLFWAAFDLLVTVVPLKVALGLDKFDFWAFQKNNHEDTLDRHLCDYFLNAQQSNFSHPKVTFNGITVTSRSKGAQNN